LRYPRDRQPGGNLTGDLHQLRTRRARPINTDQHHDAAGFPGRDVGNTLGRYAGVWHSVGIRDSCLPGNYTNYDGVYRHPLTGHVFSQRERHGLEWGLSNVDNWDHRAVGSPLKAVTAYRRFSNTFGRQFLGLADPDQLHLGYQPITISFSEEITLSGQRVRAPRLDGGRVSTTTPRTPTRGSRRLFPAVYPVL